jgi:hypothetical protein
MEGDERLIICVAEQKCVNTRDRPLCLFTEMLREMISDGRKIISRSQEMIFEALVFKIDWR